MVKDHSSERTWCVSDSPLATVFGNPADDRYHPDQNPGGYINLAIAENTMMHDNLATHLRGHFNPDSHALSDNNALGGSARLKDALAQLFNSRFAPYEPIQPQHLSITNGVHGALEQWASHIAGSGDMVLMGQPCSDSRAPDLLLRAGITTVPVTFDSVDPLSVEAVASYEQALHVANNAANDQHKIRALYLCSPQNLRGQCYPRQTLEAFMRFCQREQIHLIAEENHALNTFENPMMMALEPFTSLLAIDNNNLIDHSLVHVLWEPSKDFGADSLQIGCLVSQGNRSLINAPNSHAVASSPSAMLQHLMCCILEHPEFLDAFIADNRRKLAANFAFVTKILAAHGVPFDPDTNAGFFVYANLGEALRQQDIQRREKSITTGNTVSDRNGGDGDNNDNILAIQDTHTVTDIYGIASQFPWTELEIMASLHAHKVLITASTALEYQDEGWFRIAFSHDQQVLREGFRRIVTALGLQDDGTSELMQNLSNDFSELSCNCGFCGTINV